MEIDTRERPLQTERPMSGDEREQELVAGLREARDQARLAPEERERPEPYTVRAPASSRLPPLDSGGDEAAPTSPDREELNRIWNVDASEARTEGTLARWLRSPLRRIV